MIPDLPPSFDLQPRYLNPSGVNTWIEHIPFAYDLTRNSRPELVVELGTYYGESYFAFCQAVEEGGFPCQCRAVDTWRGDAHAGFYDDAVFAEVEAHNSAQYRRFSKLIRSRFDDAIHGFDDKSISILHIDGLHTYEAVSHDFELWLPKVRPGGIVLFHDIEERDHDFGVWRLWDELQKDFPGFSFHHGHGLGVLRNHGDVPRDWLTEILDAGQEGHRKIRDYYTRCGARLLSEVRRQARHARVQLFYSATSEFSERDSQSAYVRLGYWHPVRFRVPECFEGYARIDPADTPAIVEIAELAVERIDGECLWALDLDSANQIGACGTAVRLQSREAPLAILSTGADPILLLPKMASRPDGVVVRAVLRVRTQASEIAAYLGPTLEAGKGKPLSAR
jgi:hypothetical protein